MLAQEFAHVVHVACDECGCAALGKPRRVDFLIDVPQSLRAIENTGALQLRAIQDVGAVDVFGVEGRILAHQDHVEFAEFRGGRFAQREPVCCIIPDLERRQAAPCDPIEQPKVFLLGVMQLPAPRLRGEQQPQGGVLCRLDRPDGVHDHDETHSRRHAHCSSLAQAVKSPALLGKL